MAPLRVSSDGRLAPSHDGGNEGLSWIMRSRYRSEPESEPESNVARHHQLRRLPTLERRADTATPLEQRSTIIQPRGLHKGGIAGIVIGCVIIACIALVCLWPFIIRRIKSRKRQPSNATPDEDIENAAASSAAGTGEKAEATADHGPPTRPGSKEFLSHENGSSRPAVVKPSPSTKETAVDSTQTAYAAIQSSAANEAAVTTSDDLQRNHSQASRRLSGASTGQAPKWNTEGPPPLTPGGIELVATRADGLEYSEAMGGHSASYYHSPPDAFGITTPPMTGEEEHEPAAGRRSSSRASSLKFNLMSLVRRMSSRDAAQVPSPTTVEGFGAGAAAPASRSLGSPAFAHHASFGEHITESPVMQTGPSFQDSRYPAGHTSRLTSPVPLPMSPALTAEAACDVDATHKAGPDVLTKTGESSPPVLPPSSPPPGTVNPMDIMAPSNPSEQVWRTDQELYYMAHPEASPHSPPSLPSPTSPPLPSSPHSRPHELTSPHQPLDVPQYINSSPPNGPPEVPQHINPPHSPQQPDIPQYNSPAPPIYPPGVPQYNSPAPPIHPPDVPQYNNRPHSHHLPDGPQYINPPHSHHPLDVPQYINPPPPIPEEEIPMPATVKQEPESQGPAPIAAFPTYPVYHSMVQPSAHHAYSQLMPSIYGHAPSSDDHWTEVSDYSTPMPSQGSMLSAHATPHTQLSETSPSAISEPSYADIRNSTSPYNGVSGSPGRHTCGHCGRTFDQAHKLNHHRRYHERPHKCTHEGCNKQFGTKTHLERHINDKHNKLRKYHCLEPSCPYSKVGGKAFPRKDNWRRHMINKHGMSPSADPEPDLADDAKMVMT